MRDTATAVRDDIVTGRGEVVPLVHPQFGHFEGLYGTGLPMVFSAAAPTSPSPRPVWDSTPTMCSKNSSATTPSAWLS